MSKITIDQMEYSAILFNDSHIIFSMIDFDNWGMNVDKFMWLVECYDLKRGKNGRFLEHKFDYRLERPVLSKSKYGAIDFDVTLAEMHNIAWEIEDILEAMQEGKEKLLSAQSTK